MYTTTDYLNQLVQEKQDLVDNLNAQGVEATSNETFTTLIPKVLDIETGTDILNGVIEQYKAYTTGNDVTVSAGTFIEFIKTTSYIELSGGAINMITEYNGKCLIAYDKSGNYNNIALVNFDNNTINIEASSLIANERNAGGGYTFYDLTNNKLMYGYSNGSSSYLILINIEQNNFTLSNKLYISNGYIKSVKYVKTENNKDYYFVTYSTSGTSNIYGNVISNENNTLSKGTEQLIKTATSFSTIYDGNIYLINNKLFTFYCDNGNNTSYFDEITINNDLTFTFTNLTTLPSSSTSRSVEFNNKIYVVYNNVLINKLQVRSYTVNSTINDDANNTTIGEIVVNTFFIGILNSSVYIIFRYQASQSDNYIGFINTNSFVFSTLLINDTIGSINLQTGGAGTFNNELIVSKAPNSDRTSSLNYFIKLNGNVIVTGEMFVTPSVSKIEGLTKTDCTNLVAGDVWVLNQE